MSLTHYMICVLWVCGGGFAGIFHCRRTLDQTITTKQMVKWYLFWPYYLITKKDPT